MFFKNIKVYRLTKGFALDATILQEKLKERAFGPCAPAQAASYGWTSPTENDLLAFDIGNKIMICLLKEEKILPSSVINDLLNKKLDDIEKDSGARPLGKLKQGIRDDLIVELLPKAFSRYIKTYAYIDLNSQMIFVDSSSAGKAEEIIEALRQTLETLPVVPLTTKLPPSELMTFWLKGYRLNPDFLITDECELRDIGDLGGIIRTKNEDLTSEDIVAHLNSGMKATKLSLEFEDKIHFILNDDLSLKRLSFSDELIEEALNADTESEVMQFAADFNIMSVELMSLVHKLTKAMDGINK